MQGGPWREALQNFRKLPERLNVPFLFFTAFSVGSKQRTSGCFICSLSASPRFRKGRETPLQHPEHPLQLKRIGQPPQSGSVARASCRGQWCPFAMILSPSSNEAKQILPEWSNMGNGLTAAFRFYKV